MENVLEVKDVHKHLGKREIIKGISFNVKEGEIFGFLGPNGAGKTTTIRMLVGMIKPNNGSISIMGHDINKDKVNALKHIGAVVENPEMYTYLSGMDNLKLVASLRNIPKKDLEDVIEMVNLKDRINDKVKKYSLGMKQRLGLASALIGKPSLLILDEPTNGLDPTGILDFREIVKKAARERNTAVLISSHILSEVQHLCDTVAFINKGTIQSIESIKDGTVNNKTDTVVLVIRESEKCSEILKTMEYIYDFTSENNVFTLNVKADSTPEIVFNLAKNNIAVREIYKKNSDLEERYMELVEGGVRS
ncbi:MAG: ABC transporter ATP-binding protein [Bacillota bacterium]|nr:ABC transporter ATP-binding protein [Bacillota bacterium]